MYRVLILQIRQRCIRLKICTAQLEGRGSSGSWFYGEFFSCRRENRTGEKTCISVKQCAQGMSPHPALSSKTSNTQLLSRPSERCITPYHLMFECNIPMLT